MDEVNFKKEYADFFLHYQIDENAPLYKIASDINKQLLLQSENDVVDFSEGSKKMHKKLGDILLRKYLEEELSSDEIDNGSILFWAIFYLKEIIIIRNILQREVNVNKVTYDPDNDYRSTPLFQAIRKERTDLVQFLLETGNININLKPHGETVLIFTLRILFHSTVHEKECHNIIKLLLLHVDINVHDETRGGESAINFTIQNMVLKKPHAIGYEIFKSLITHKNFELSFLPSTLNEILEQPAFDIKLINDFLECYPDQKHNALIFSIRLGHSEAFRLLLKEKDVNVVVDGLTLLHHAVYYNATRIIKLLLGEKKIDLNAGSVSVILLAVKLNNRDIVKQLLTFYNTWKKMGHTTLLANSSMPEKLPSYLVKNIIMNFLIPLSEWPELQSDFTFYFPGEEPFTITKDSTLLSIAVENNNPFIVFYLLHYNEWSREHLETLLKNVEPTFKQVENLLEEALSKLHNSDEPPPKKNCP